MVEPFTEMVKKHFWREYEKFWFKSLIEKHSSKRKCVCFNLCKITRQVWPCFVSHLSFYLIFTRVLWSKRYYLWSIDEETEAQVGWMTHTGCTASKVTNQGCKPNSSKKKSKAVFITQYCCSQTGSFSIIFVTKIFKYNHGKSVLKGIKVALM